MNTNTVSAYTAGRPPRNPDNDALVTRHAELVKRIAYHLAGRLPASVDVADLIQPGMVAQLVNHGALDLPGQFVRLREILLERQPEDRDLVRELCVAGPIGDW